MTLPFYLFLLSFLFIVDISMMGLYTDISVLLPAGHYSALYKHALCEHYGACILKLQCLLRSILLNVVLVWVFGGGDAPY